MKRIIGSTVAGSAALLLALAGCGGGSDSTDGGGSGDGGGDGGGGHQKVATAVRIDPATVTLTEGQTLTLSAIATYDDASESDVTADVTFAIDGAAATLAGAVVTAVAPGTATVTATLGELSTQAGVTIAEAAVERLELRGEGAWAMGETVQLSVVGIHPGGRETPIADGVTFSSSNDRIATVDATGLVSVHARGPVTVTASAAGLEGTLFARTTCDYPRYSPQLQWDRVMPPLSWPAKWPDGSDFELDLEAVYCDAEWSNVQTMIFVISAGWCTPCTLYAQRLELETEALAALGAQIVIMEAQDTDGLPADVEFAYRHVDRITGTPPGIMIGDADTRPEANFVQNSAIVRAFPSVFVVRTRDMKIIADQNRSDYYLPLQQIAADPEADWSNPGLPSFTNHCEAGQDEASEPNDLPEQAAPIGAGTFQGGICTDAVDLYRIELDGPWTLALDFEHAVGDLDVFVWDEARNQPAQQNGQVIGSTGATGHEEFQHQGRVLVAVQGYQHASAPYTLTLTER